MPARALTALLLLALPSQSSPQATARVVVQYRVSSEDDTSNSGKVTIALKAGQTGRARIWETSCHLTAVTDDTATPADAEQVWGMSAELTRDRDNRPAVRLTTSHVAPNGVVHDETHVLALDDARPLALSELSARTDCRYDRIHLTIAAESVRAGPGSRTRAPRARPL